MPKFFVGSIQRMESDLISSQHRHPFYEILLIVRGDGKIVVDDQGVRMHEGDLLIISPNVPHGGSSEGSYQEIYIQIDSFPALADPLKNSFFYVERNDDDLLVSLAQNLLYRFVRDSQAPMVSLMYELFLRLLEEKCAPPKKDPVVEEVCDLLARNYHDPELSIAKILTATGYQKDHIRRRFVAACGVTPVEYLTELRIENAKRLLKRRVEMGLTITEIALRCGYYDSHYFSKVFKKCVGVSPEHFVVK